jgi:hypothetical protein
VGLEIRQLVIGHIAGGGPHVRDDPLFGQFSPALRPDCVGQGNLGSTGSAGNGGTFL